MLIFTNCLTDTADEGCVKTACSLVKRIKAASDDVRVVSYERTSPLADEYVKSNKLLLTAEIIKAVRKEKQRILYIPFPARSVATALRIFVLSLISRKKPEVLLTQVTDIGSAAKLLLKISGASFYVLSDDTERKLESVVGAKKIRRIKAGVQTDKFVPVTKQRAEELKKKFGLSPEKPVVLHVGHLNRGRNVEQLMKINESYQILLVTSTLTKDEQDSALKNELLSRSDLKIIDDYIPCIEEIYQLADVYFFPVIEEGRCIDAPLSCLEAASCGKPVVTTDFGEMKEFREKNGFWFIESFDAENLNRLIDEAAACKDGKSREAVSDYDWSKAAEKIIE